MLAETVANSNAGVKRRFLALLPEIMLNPKLSPNAKVVYAILVNAHFEGQDIVIGLDRIAGYLGKDRRAAGKAIAELKRAELIDQQPSQKQYNVNRYALTCDKNVTTDRERATVSRSTCSEIDTTGEGKLVHRPAGCDDNDTTTAEVVAKTTHELIQNGTVSCDEIDTQPIRNSLNLITNRVAALKIKEGDEPSRELLDAIRACGRSRKDRTIDSDARYALTRVSGIPGGYQCLIGWLRWVAERDDIADRFEYAVNKARRFETPPYREPERLAS